MKTQAKEQNKSGKSKISFTEVREETQAKLNITCEAHGVEMSQAGKSTRGVPEYFCPEGCQVELGEGRISNLLREKGYGFIEVEGDYEDIFVHFSQLDRPNQAQEGDLVRFKIGLNPVKGELQAVHVRNLSAKGGRRDK